MKNLRFAALAAALLVTTPVLAQWQTPNHSVPIGRGAGVQGFGSAAPGTAGKPYVSTGPTTDPVFGNIANSGFAAGAANTVKGSLNGTDVVDIAVPPCTAVNQAIRWTAGTGPGCGGVLTLTGYDMPLNAGLSSSVVGGALTINLTAADGTAPTVGAPVLVPFRSTTLTDGKVMWGTISASTSITIPSGATLGTTNSTPFRLWVFIGYNGGAPQLGIATCSSPTTIYSCANWESTLKTSIAIDASAASGGTLYTPTAVTLDAVRIIGYCDFSNGLATAGLWASACTTLQPFGPGVKKPGDVVQTLYSATGTATTGSTSVGVFTATATAQTFTPQSAVNLTRIYVDGVVGQSNSGSAVAYGVYRTPGASPGCTALVGGLVGTNTQATSSIIPAAARRLEALGSVAQVTYGVCIGLSSGSVAPTWCNASGLGASLCSIQVEEIQG